MHLLPVIQNAIDDSLTFKRSGLTALLVYPMALCNREDVRWLNEGPKLPASTGAGEQQRPKLHSDARGFYLCAKCGGILRVPDDEPSGGKGRQKPRKTDGPDPFGHGNGCSDAGKRPVPLALTTASPATTLRIQVVLPLDFGQDEYERWGYSLGYSLRIGMR